MAKITINLDNVKEIPPVIKNIRINSIASFRENLKSCRETLDSRVAGSSLIGVRLAEIEKRLSFVEQDLTSIEGILEYAYSEFDMTENAIYRMVKNLNENSSPSSSVVNKTKAKQFM